MDGVWPFAAREIPGSSKLPMDKRRSLENFPPLFQQPKLFCAKLLEVRIALHGARHRINIYRVPEGNASVGQYRIAAAV